MKKISSQNYDFYFIKNSIAILRCVKQRLMHDKITINVILG